MKLLLTILGDSFIIWSRNFALMYILLFLSLLVGLMMPQSENPAWELRWILLFLTILLLAAAVMSGWFHMVGRACHLYLQEAKKIRERSDSPENALPANIPLQALMLFREFLPGVSRYFLSVTTALLMHLLVPFLLFLKLQPLWAANAPLMDKFYKAAMATPNLNQQDLSRIFAPQELHSLEGLAMATLGALFVYGLFSMLTMLWPAYIVLYRKSAIAAYRDSIVRFFKDPLRLLLVSGVFMTLQFILNLGASTGASANSFFLLIFCQFASLMLEIYMAVVIFVYVLRMAGEPTWEEEPAAPAGLETGEPPEAG